MRINTNVASLVAQENAANTQFKLSSSLEKLSSGLKINKAADDASGLAIADKLRTQGTSIDQGIANGNSAVTLLQIADKSMSEQSNILDTIKAKLIQANTDTTSDDGRESIRKDISKLLEQLDNIAEQTNYNGNVLLQSGAGDSVTDRAVSADLNFQIGESKNDIISNTSVQSNTDGLGSKESYSDGSLVAQGATLTIASAGSITIKGTDASGTVATENVTLTGDVDALTLTAGMTIKDVNADTKVVLDLLVTAGDLTHASGTYTVTTQGTTASDVNFSTVDAVQATVEISTSGSAGTSQVIATGQMVNLDSGVTSGALFDKLNDASKFAKGTDGDFRALSSETLDISLGETITVTTLNNLASGTSGGTFDAGDTITATNVTTGSLLDLELKDTSKFSTGATTGTYVVKKDFTAGDLNIGLNESIKITQGIAVTNAAITTGLTESAISVDGTTVFRLTGTTTIIDVAATGDQVNATNKDIFKFTVTGATGTTGTTVSQTILAGDIITFSDDTTATGGGDTLSQEILSSGNFLNLGGSKYQLKDTLGTGSVTLSMGLADVVNVERQLISAGGDTTVSGNAGNVVAGAGSAAAEIKLSTNTTLSVENKDTTTGNTLAISSDGTNTMDNGKLQLSALAALGEGELTKALADSFQSVVDDAITVLNGYRGDVGSTQNQVESAVRNLMTQSTNVKAAESIIRDVDYAKESANFNKQNIISQAGTYAMSQANSAAQNVLRLLQ